MLFGFFDLDFWRHFGLKISLCRVTTQCECRGLQGPLSGCENKILRHSTDWMLDYGGLPSPVYDVASRIMYFIYAICKSFVCVARRAAMEDFAISFICKTDVHILETFMQGSNNYDIRNSRG